MKEMSERRAHLLMQRGSETLRRSTGSLFACIVTHPMRNARSCAAVMAMGSWKQPDERCYIEQPWAAKAWCICCCGICVLPGAAMTAAPKPRGEGTPETTGIGPVAAERGEDRKRGKGDQAGNAVFYGKLPKQLISSKREALGHRVASR